MRKEIYKKINTQCICERCQKEKILTIWKSIINGEESFVAQELCDCVPEQNEPFSTPKIISHHIERLENQIFLAKKLIAKIKIECGLSDKNEELDYDIESNIDLLKKEAYKHRSIRDALHEISKMILNNEHPNIRVLKDSQMEHFNLIKKNLRDWEKEDEIKKQVSNNGLPFSEPVIEFNSDFVFTGKFLSATRGALEFLVSKKGGCIQDRVTASTRYIIIGEHPDPRYAYGNYGTKIREALERESQIKFIRESYLTKVLNEDKSLL